MYTEAVIVCGYGCHLNGQISSYLAEVAAYLVKRPEALVIVSGGRTNERTAPGVSEAGMMEEFLRKALGVSQHIVREADAVTTLQNLRCSRQIMQVFQPAPNITIFCDSIRAFKARYLARRVFGKHEILGGIPVRVIGCDFKRSFREKLHQFLVATPAEILSYYLPRLERRMREHRLALNRTR